MWEESIPILYYSEPLGSKINICSSHPPTSGLRQSNAQIICLPREEGPAPFALFTRQQVYNADDIWNCRTEADGPNKTGDSKFWLLPLNDLRVLLVSTLNYCSQGPAGWRLNFTVCTVRQNSLPVLPRFLHEFVDLYWSLFAVTTDTWKEKVLSFPRQVWVETRPSAVLYHDTPDYIFACEGSKFRDRRNK